MRVAVPYGSYGVDYVHRSRAPRALLVVQRALQRSISRALLHEFEDLVAEIDDVDIAAPLFVPSSSAVRQRCLRISAKVGRRFCGHRYDDRFCRPQLERGYDLVFVSCEDSTDLNRIGSVRSFVAAGKRSVCYIHEVWVKHVEQRPEMRLLPLFDVVFTSTAGAVDAIRQLTGRPCHYLPPAVDAALFCPFPDPPYRCIDLYNMGRRSDVTHRSILAAANASDFFYVYDTFTGNQAIAPREHRLLLSNLIKRSRFFVANRAKIDEPNLTANQPEIGARHFEGAAAGAVVVGEPPDCATFAEHLGWEDAVVPVPFHAPDMLQRLRDLERDSVRIEAIRRRNVKNCLSRHDWSWRWEQVLRAVGMAPTPRLVARQQRLQALAASV